MGKELFVQLHGSLKLNRVKLFVAAVDVDVVVSLKKLP